METAEDDTEATQAIQGIPHMATWHSPQDQDMELYQNFIDPGGAPVTSNQQQQQGSVNVDIDTLLMPPPASGAKVRTSSVFDDLLQNMSSVQVSTASTTPSYPPLPSGPPPSLSLPPLPSDPPPGEIGASTSIANSATTTTTTASASTSTGTNPLLGVAQSLNLLPIVGVSSGEILTLYESMFQKIAQTHQDNVAKVENVRLLHLQEIHQLDLQAKQLYVETARIRNEVAKNELEQRKKIPLVTISDDTNDELAQSSNKRKLVDGANSNNTIKKPRGAEGTVVSKKTYTNLFSKVTAGINIATLCDYHDRIVAKQENEWSEILRRLNNKEFIIFKNLMDNDPGHSKIFLQELEQS